MRIRGGRALGIAVIVAALGAPATATAATITVDSVAEASSASECTLRDAIASANGGTAVGGCDPGSAGLDTIRFALPDSPPPIYLQAPLDRLEGELEIVGHGPKAETISGGEEVRVFDVAPGATVKIEGVAIKSGACATGCGIRNAGDLTLSGVLLDGNVAAEGNEGVGEDNEPSGGAILNLDRLRLLDSSLSNNTAKAVAGVAENVAAGGAIENRGTLTIERSTLSGNTAVVEAGPGGAAAAFGGGVVGDGEMTVRASTFSGNRAVVEGQLAANEAAGGAIALFGAGPGGVGLTIESSTFAANSAGAFGPEPGFAEAGAILVEDAGAVRIAGSTIAGNEAAAAANLEIAAAAVSVENTIIAALGEVPGCGTPLVSAGHNLDDDESCGFDAATDLSSVDPMLGPLADNGGPTETMAPADESPAVDSGLAPAAETTDQRGLPRRSDFPELANAAGSDGADIGAVELQGGLLPGETPDFVPAAVRPAPAAPPADTTAPRLRLVRGPGARTKDRTPTFRFGSEPGARFRCKVDSGPFLACRSPFTTKRLSYGPHRVKLRALDAAGNASPPAVRRFEVLRPSR